MEKKVNELPNDPVYSKTVLEMLTIANEYCLFLEKAEDYSRQDILAFLQKICPLIYLKGSLLPVIELKDEEAAEHFVTEEEWEGLFNTLHQKFGEDDLYYFIDPHERSHTDPVKASMAENFTDIYQDLKDFVLLYQKPRKASMEFAVYECKRLFETRYGFRLVRAHSALHYLLHKEGDKGELQDLLDML
ncbi:MAG: DUF5063 domain-containing protein [Bacteroidetes bacterium]|nr:DUF5063 domain-containing protein [Bacteroidota bacterium]